MSAQTPLERAWDEFLSRLPPGLGEEELLAAPFCEVQDLIAEARLDAVTAARAEVRWQTLRTLRVPQAVAAQLGWDDATPQPTPVHEPLPESSAALRSFSAVSVRSLQPASSRCFSPAVPPPASTSQPPPWNEVSSPPPRARFSLGKRCTQPRDTFAWTAPAPAATKPSVVSRRFAARDANQGGCNPNSCSRPTVEPKPQVRCARREAAVSNPNLTCSGRDARIRSGRRQAAVRSCSADAAAAELFPRPQRRPVSPPPPRVVPERPMVSPMRCPRAASSPRKPGRAHVAEPKDRDAELERKARAFVLSRARRHTGEFSIGWTR